MFFIKKLSLDIVFIKISSDLQLHLYKNLQVPDYIFFTFSIFLCYLFIINIIQNIYVLKIIMQYVIANLFGK